MTKYIVLLVMLYTASAAFAEEDNAKQEVEAESQNVKESDEEKQPDYKKWSDMTQAEKASAISAMMHQRII